MHDETSDFSRVHCDFLGITFVQEIFHHICNFGKKQLPSPDLTRSSQFSFVLHLLRHNTWLGNCAHAYVASIYGAVAMSQANRPVVMAPEAQNRVERWRWFVDGWQDMKKVDFIELKWSGEVCGYLM